MLLSGKRIFYVEDDVTNRAIAQMILEQAGAVMGFERWGRNETVARLRDFMPVDLILVDLMLPGDVTGYDVYDNIRSHFEFATTPIVAVSASDAASEVPRTRARGFAGFIGKPIDLRLFPGQIASLIQGEHVWHST